MKNRSNSSTKQNPENLFEVYNYNDICDNCQLCTKSIKFNFVCGFDSRVEATVLFNDKKLLISIKPWFLFHVLATLQLYI